MPSIVSGAAANAPLADVAGCQQRGGQPHLVAASVIAITPTAISVLCVMLTPLWPAAADEKIFRAGAVQNLQQARTPGNRAVRYSGDWPSHRQR